MNDNTNTKSLQRFLDAQQHAYEAAFSEVKNGKKQSHWMWYIFPQIEDLGVSETSKYYAIKSVDEGTAFLKHPVLGSRLVAICELLLSLERKNATAIFGSPDDVKLRSSMTLFAALPDPHPVFQAVLDKFFKGIKDDRTVRKIGGL